MLILLPPSESKAARTRGKPVDPSALSFPGLAERRAEVADALAEVSARPDAPEVLGVSPNLTDEIARNTVLATAPSLPAGECYTGVLYDALDLAGLDAAYRRRANRRILVISALYGAVRLTDRIAPYRLAMDVKLPGIGPLAKAWRPDLDRALTPHVGKGVIVDCRSATYAAAWSPTGDLAKRWVQITVPGASHMAKHTRGLVARALAESAADPKTPRALAAQLGEHFDVDLTEPTSPRRPYTLATTAR
ncbi:YaaA family protein [Janibacter sp. GXQ6167]|uniref:YaaA family protein n=1 Tax=Janibacter sp. GXQ6167 TaxID=3240791 RepID=UPI0035251314